MRLPELFKSRPFVLSIEVFPPKSAEGDSALYQTLDQLLRFRPGFVSCTYGAGGSTRDRTAAICEQIQHRFQVPATAHFTCVGSTRDELLAWLESASRKGIRNIMALRGDPPKGQESFMATIGGLRHANELVELIRKTHPEMGIGVAGYPEKHPEATDMKSDLANLKRKVDAGADAIFTQLFYANKHFFQFRDECQKLGISVPIVPGIMPITEFSRIKRIAAMCGAYFPEGLASRLEAVQDDLPAQFEIGVEYAITQCQDLIRQGVPGIHFYALNKSQACERILDALGSSLQPSKGTS